MPSNKLDSLGVPTHITLLLCFTRFGRDPGTKVAALGVPTFNVLLCFTCFEWTPLNKLDSLGVPTLNVSVVFYTL